jgi:rubredoxin
MMPDPITCPVCSNTDWQGFPHLFKLREDDPHILRGGGLAVTGYACSTCGYVRLHTAEGEGGQATDP